jgi:hypothetical protein
MVRRGFLIRTEVIRRLLGLHGQESTGEVSSEFGPTEVIISLGSRLRFNAKELIDSGGSSGGLRRVFVRGRDRLNAYG